MTNGKYRISFELTDNYNIVGFRNFIKQLLSDEETYEVFIISNDDNSAYISKTAENLKINESHTIICNFAEDKLTAIREKNIDIHLDNLQSFILLVDNMTENSHGVLVTKNLNKFYLVPDYTIVFNRLLKEIKNEEN